MTEKDIFIEDEDTEKESAAETAETDTDAEVEVKEGADDAAADEQDAAVEELSELEVAQKENEELRDKYLRSVAEFDNFRKRTLKEKAELILNGGKKVISAILPVVDDMERAIDNGSKTDDPQVLREGMELIYHKLMKVLEAQGVAVIDTEDADFDTDIHEAVAMVPGMGDDKKGKVIDCLQKGYKLNDQVIRHAKVAVGN
jgi:molecular chaperone GrpE